MIHLQSPYTISIPMQVRIVMLRRIQIMKGNFTAQALSTTLVNSFPFVSYNLTTNPVPLSCKPSFSGPLSLIFLRRLQLISLVAVYSSCTTFLPTTNLNLVCNTLFPARFSFQHSSACRKFRPYFHNGQSSSAIAKQPCITLSLKPWP